MSGREVRCPRCGNGPLIVARNCYSTSTCPPCRIEFDDAYGEQRPVRNLPTAQQSADARAVYADPTPAPKALERALVERDEKHADALKNLQVQLDHAWAFEGRFREALTEASHLLCMPGSPPLESVPAELKRQLECRRATAVPAGAQADRIAVLEAALNWALGAGGEFPLREEGQGAYWWRPALQLRANLEYNGQKFVGVELEPDTGEPA